MSSLKELYLMQQIFVTLFSIANDLQVKGDQYLEDLTIKQFLAMLAIAHLPEDETSLNNIAKKLDTTKQSARQLISNLEKKKYIETIPSPKDSRALNVRFTDEGGKMLLKSSEKSIDFLKDVFKGLSIEDLESLWAILKSILNYNSE